MEADHPPEPDEDADVGSDAGGAFGRRGFLIGAGALSGAVAAEAVSLAAKQSLAHKAFPQTVAAAEQIADFKLRSKPTFTALVRRREDFLFLRVDGYNLVRANLHVKKGAPHSQHLIRHLAGHDAFLVFEHLPQHLVEQAYNGAPGAPVPGAPGIAQARLADPTRLAFRIPSAMKSIPYTLASLLGWDAFEPSLVPAAEPAQNTAVTRRTKKPATPAPISNRPPVVGVSGPAPKIRAPTATETAIELPWRLALSPLPGGRWSHPTDPRTLAGSTELWHTRLAASADRLAPDGAPVRAVWNYDTVPVKKNSIKRKPTLSDAEVPDIANDAPFLASLTAINRYEIVRATSDFKLVGRSDVEASKLWLSSRGGFLDSIGVWDFPLSSPVAGLAGWKHLTTLGRDQYVKVVDRGFLFPFGHGAVTATVSERHFEKVDGEIVAVWRQTMYIVVRQPVRNYDASVFGVANDSRDFPFRSLRITTLRTPALVASTKPFAATVASSFLANVVRGGQTDPFPFHFIGTDWVGRNVDFTAPAVFVGLTDGFDATKAAAVRTAYNNLADGASNVGAFQGQAVAYAASHTKGDTDLETHKMTFGAGAGIGGSQAAFETADQPITYPNLVSAEVRLGAAEQASGGPLTGPTPLVAYHGTYIATEFVGPQNIGRVFMDVLPDNQPAVNFGGGSSGGVITPNLTVSALSRSLGPIAGSSDTVKDIAAGTFNAADVFAQADAKIMGGVKIVKLLANAFLGDGDKPDPSALQITYDASGTSQVTRLKWTPKFDTDNANPVVQQEPNKVTSVELDATVTTDSANSANSSFTINGSITNFVVYLMENDATLGFIAIHIHELTFSAAKGQKSHVHVDLANVEFLGVLEFVMQLETLIDFSGEGGPKIAVTPTAITADLAIPIPDIGVGILSLTNIAIDMGFNLPFDGSPARFRFSFATRDNLFGLSVAIFGGGGFFGIAIGTDGVELIEASLDFGAMCAINLGVASGSIHLLAGIYFSYGPDDNGDATCVLSGFVKLGGQLSILGLISLSLEFDMTLTYVSNPSSVTGTATLSVGVSVLFFSFSVSVTASKTFGGGSNGASIARFSADTPPGGALTFGDQVAGSDWITYCNAFAAG